MLEMLFRNFIRALIEANLRVLCISLLRSSRAALLLFRAGLHLCSIYLCLLNSHAWFSWEQHFSIFLFLELGNTDVRKERLMLLWKPLPSEKLRSALNNKIRNKTKPEPEPVTTAQWGRRLSAEGAAGDGCCMQWVLAEFLHGCQCKRFQQGFFRNGSW